MHCLSIITVLCILGSLQLAHGQSAPTCTRLKIRKEVKSLSTAERQDFINAINRMKTGGVYDRFTQKHLEGLQYHNTMWFYPFHRALVNEFEDEMLKNSGGVIQGLPYWDEGADYNAPLETPLFTPQYMGSVTVGQRQCLQAPFEGWTHDGQCVARYVRRATISTGGTLQAWIVPAQTLAEGLAQLKIIGQNFFAFANDGTTTQTVVPLSQFTLADVQNFNTRLCYDYQVSAPARRLTKRQAASQPDKLPFLASLTDEEIRTVLPRINVEDYRKAEQAFNNITTRINEELQKGKPLSSFKTLSQLYQEGSTPVTTNSASSLGSDSTGLVASLFAAIFYSLL